MAEILAPADLRVSICKEWAKKALDRMSTESTPSVEIELTGFSEEDVPFVRQVLVPHIRMLGYDAGCRTCMDDEQDEDSATIVYLRVSVPVPQKQQ
jgi:hypothetical protein